MIPMELRERPQWLAWDYEEREGKPTKVPRDPKTCRPGAPRTGRHGKSTDPATWGTYEQALVAGGPERIGFAVTADDPYCGIDIDHCLRQEDGTRILATAAETIMRRLNSYTEITPSGESMRIWVKARLTRPGNKRALGDGVDIEIYDHGRYFTVTGRSGRTTPAEIHDRQTELDALHLELFPPRPVETGPFRGAALQLGDLDLLAKARAARNGASFERLWAGDCSDYGGDDSRADFALLMSLAFWTARDHDQMDRLFRQSGLYREKWEREDYRLRSLRLACERVDRVYEIQAAAGNGRGTHAPPADTDPPEPGAADSGVLDADLGLISIQDLDADIDRYYEHGWPVGDDLGWPSLSPLYTVQRHQWTLVTGRPGSGKSEWLDAVAVQLITRHGWRFAICSPEKQPLEMHFALLAQRLLGRPWGGPDRLNRDELAEAKRALDPHVIFALPPEPTIDAVLLVATRIIARRGLDGLIVDPWNELDHSRPARMSETEYISMALTTFKAFARRHAIHLWLVAHPTKLHREFRLGPSGKRIVDSEGKALTYYPVVRPYDISGSAHWYNKADTCITVHRDEENAPNTVEIHVQKVRFKFVGHPGVATLSYAHDTGGFQDVGLGYVAGPGDGGGERPRYERDDRDDVDGQDIWSDPPADGRLSLETEADLRSLGEQQGLGLSQFPGGHTGETEGVD